MTIELQRHPVVVFIHGSKSTYQLQVRDHFTFILGYELFSLFKTIFDWNVEQQYHRCSFTVTCICARLDSLPCSFTFISCLTNLCLSVKLDSLPCSFKSISFLTTGCSFTVTCIYVQGWIVSLVHLHPYPVLLIHLS